MSTGGHSSVVRAPAVSGSLAARQMVPARRPESKEVLARRVPLGLIALAAMTLLWTRIVPLANGYSADEIARIVPYVHLGPAGIFSHYAANDHMLFGLLAWATTNVTGDHSEAAYRFWGVIPAITAAALLTWWLWRRVDAWVAAIFLVLAAASPLYTDLGVGATGFGLSFLAAAVMLIAADSYARTRQRRALVLLTAGGLLGTLTLPVSGLVFLALLALLALHKGQRRRLRPLTLALGIVGTVSLLFYLPVLGAVADSAGRSYGSPLPWYGFITRPDQDLLQRSVGVVLRTSLTVQALIAGTAVLVGALVLLQRVERFLAAAILWPVILIYVIVDAGRFSVASGFASFELLPLLVLAAVGLVQIVRLFARRSVIAAFVLAVAFALLTLAKGNQRFIDVGRFPSQNFKQAAGIAMATGVKTVFTNSLPVNYQYYLRGRSRAQRKSPPALATLFCTRPGPFIYLEYVVPASGDPGVIPYPPADVSCLRARGAVAISVEQQQRDTNRVWLVPPGTPAGSG